MLAKLTLTDPVPPYPQYRSTYRSIICIFMTSPRGNDDHYPIEASMRPHQFRRERQRCRNEQAAVESFCFGVETLQFVHPPVKLLHFTKQCTRAHTTQRQYDIEMHSGQYHLSPHSPTGIYWRRTIRYDYVSRQLFFNPNFGLDFCRRSGLKGDRNSHGLLNYFAQEVHATGSLY